MKEINDIKEIQDILFDNLLNFKKICEKNHLKYYLSNGTLLGAIKYKGFVPWDDDIDVFMPREDYDKLMKLHDFDEGNYELLSKEKNSNWALPFSKIKDKRTIVQETTADFGLENGLAVDIFPLDNWYGDKEKAIVQSRYCGLLRRFLSASIETEFFSPKTGWQRFILFLIWKFSRLMGSTFFYKQIMNQVNKGRNQEKTSYKGSVAWSLYGEKEVIPASIFEKSVDVSFRNEIFPGPVGYDEYLRNLYGDYFQDPPLEKQKSHHKILAWWKDYE